MLELYLGDHLVRATYSRFLRWGTTLGVAAILIVLSLFANYYQAVEQTFLGIHPHLRLHKAELSPRDLEESLNALESEGDAILAALPAVDLTVRGTVSAVASYPVVCVDREQVSECFDFEAAGAPGPSVDLREAVGYEVRAAREATLRLRGVTVDGGATVSELRQVMDVWSPEDLERLDAGPEEGMPMGCLFERTLFHGASRLDDFLVSLSAAGGTAQPAGGTAQPFRLVSTLDLGMQAGKVPVFVTSLDNARRLLGRPGFTNTIEVRLRDPFTAPRVAERLDPALAAAGVSVTSWIEEEAGAFRLLEVLRRVIFVVLSSVLTVAALGIVSTLSLVVVERRRQIAILRAMGLRDVHLYLAWILKGWKIALGGLALGALGGYLASAVLLRLPAFRDGLAKLGIREPQVLFEPRDVALLAVSTLILYLMVALLPARQACRIDPVEGLRS